MFRRVSLIILLLLTLLKADDNLAYGWDVPESSLNIGGYSDLIYDTQREPELLIDDIALLVSATKNRFDFLAEMEFSHISLDFNEKASREVEFYVEQLHLSYNFNEEQMLRVGRFNSQIGFWNMIPIPILEDTTTKPHFLGHMFPRYTFGAMFKQEIDENNKLLLTLQKNRDFTHQEYALESKEHLSLAYYGEKDDLLWHLSIGEYEDTSENDFNYLGLALQYDGEDIGLQSEVYMQESNVKNYVPYSGYAQATWHFEEHQDLVGRVERYKDTGLNVEENIYLFGYAYRPTPNMALKAEYIKHSVLPINQMVYSFSVLF